MTPLISSAHLAETLGVTRQHVWNLSVRGTIPFYRVGRSMKYALNEVLGALKQR